MSARAIVTRNSTGRPARSAPGRVRNGPLTAWCRSQRCEAIRRPQHPHHAQAPRNAPAHDRLPCRLRRGGPLHRAGRAVPDRHLPPRAPGHRHGAAGPFGGGAGRRGRGVRRTRGLPGHLFVPQRAPGRADGRGHHQAAARRVLRPRPATAVRLPRQDADRRPHRAGDLGHGRGAQVLRRPGHRVRPDHAPVRGQLHGDLAAVVAAGPGVGRGAARGARRLDGVFQGHLEALRKVPGAGGDPLDHPAGEPHRRARGEGVRPPDVRGRALRPGEPREVPPGAAPPDDERRVLAGHGHPLRRPDARRVRLRRPAGHQRRHHRRHLRRLRRHDPAADLADPGAWAG